MRPAQLQAPHQFLAVARSGGVIRVAEHPHLTAITVSGQITQLPARHLCPPTAAWCTPAPAVRIWPMDGRPGPGDCVCRTTRSDLTTACRGVCGRTSNALSGTSFCCVPTSMRTSTPRRVGTCDRRRRASRALATSPGSPLIALCPLASPGSRAVPCPHSSGAWPVPGQSLPSG